MLTALPGRLRVVAPPLVGDELVASLQALLDGSSLAARVERVDPPPRWDRAAVRKLCRGPVDYLLLSEGGPPPAEEVVAALRVLRSDLTTAASGPPPYPAEEGELVLAVSGGSMLVRQAAFASVGGLAPRGTAPLHDLDLCARLWRAGHRVRASGARPRPMAGQAAAHEVLTATVGSVLGQLAGRRAGPGDGSAAPQRGAPELARLASRWMAAWAAAGGPPLDGVVSTSRLLEDATSPHRVLVITTDVLAPAMAGPAIRAVAIARALSAEHTVRLVSTARCTLTVPGFEASRATERELRSHVDWADIIVLQGWAMAGRPWMRDAAKVLVVDVYDPMQLEQLEQGREAEGERGRVEAVRGVVATLNEQLRRADVLLCASDKQRDLWLGALATLGRVNPVTYDDDPALRRLIDVVPFGVPDEPFPSGPGAIKGVVEGIGPDDPVILWGGGVYNWFDPLTLVRAVDRLRERIPTIRLYFMGMIHPNPAIPAMQMASDLRTLAGELGLAGVHVFFNDGWVPHDERMGYLRDADIGVSTHLDHIETAFSFRTRILDYLWAGLPVVATSGDSFAELLEHSGGGVTVSPGDVDGLAAAIEGLLLDGARRERARAGALELGRRLTWSRNLEPLIEVCREPRRAPDVACPTLVISPEGAEMRRGLGRDIDTMVAYLRAGGVRMLVARGWARLRRLRAERAADQPRDSVARPAPDATDRCPR